MSDGVAGHVPDAAHRSRAPPARRRRRPWPRRCRSPAPRIPRSRHGAQVAWSATLWQKTCPPKSRSGVHDRRGQRHARDRRWSRARRARRSRSPAGARTPRAHGAGSAAAGSTQSPAPRTNGGPWSSYTSRTQPLVAEDQLKADRMEVHHVGHRPGVRDADVRSDDAAAEPAWNQVAVVHPGAADHPGRVVLQAAHDEGMRGRRRLHRTARRRPDGCARRWEP